MMLVLKFHPHTASGFHLNIRHHALQGLDARHFIKTVGHLPTFGPRSRLFVDLADVLDFGGKVRVGGDEASRDSGAVSVRLRLTNARQGDH